MSPVHEPLLPRQESSSAHVRMWWSVQDKRRTSSAAFWLAQPLGHRFTSLQDQKFWLRHDVSHDEGVIEQGHRFGRMPRQMTAEESSLPDRMVGSPACAASPRGDFDLEVTV